MNKQTLNTIRMLVETAAAVAIVQAAAMLMLTPIAAGASNALAFLLYTAILSVIAAPVIVWRVRSALNRTHVAAITDLVLTPRRVTLLTVGVLIGGLATTAMIMEADQRGGYVAAHTILGVGGCFMSLLAAGFTHSLLTGRAKTVALAKSMTAELTAAKKAADRLADIARKTSNAVVITDPLGRVEWVNEGFTRISGYTLDDVRGRKPGHVLQGPESDPAMAAKMREAIDTGEAATVEIVNYAKSGGAYRLRIEITPLRDVTGHLTGFMAIESDITEQHQGQEALRTANAQLVAARQAAEAASRAKSAFLANMSHEIRTPLTAILGFADLLREDGQIHAAPPSRLQAIDTIRQAGAHLLTVINDILDLSKIEADKMTVEHIDTPLVSVMREVESLMRPKALGKGVQLEAVLSTPVPEHIFNDPTRLRQILMNLAGNAVKFTEAGRITLAAGVAEQGGTAQLVIDVTDTGAGMSAQQATRLFQAFGQADETVTRKHGGTGLGLTICRRLAKLMNGDVTLLHSEPGKGSCFRLALPLVPVPGTPLVTHLDAVQHQRPQSPSTVQLSGRILLAEDGVDNQRLIAFHLRKAGATVDIADNGRFALEMLDKAYASGTPYSLLLTDMQMPEMDGYSLARTLRERGGPAATLAIVALTAHAMAEDRQRCLDAGCDDYATKPIDRTQLLATCAAWMDRKHAAPGRSIAA